jgi:hypothetical protein
VRDAITRFVEVCNENAGPFQWRKSSRISKKVTLIYASEY